MSHLSRITEAAIKKNTEMPDPVGYSESLGRAYAELENFDVFIKWINLDLTNRALVADELGITIHEFNLFLAINKAIYNGSKFNAEDLVTSPDQHKSFYTWLKENEEQTA